MKVMVRLNSAEVAAMNKMVSAVADKDVEIGTKGYESEALTTEVAHVDDFTVIGIDANDELVTDISEMIGDTLAKYMGLVKIFTKNAMALMDKWFTKEN